MQTENMKAMKKMIIYAALLCAASVVSGQTFTAAPSGIKTPVHWDVSVQSQNADTATLLLHAKVDSLWKVYAPYIATELPLPLAVTLSNGNAADIVELTTAIEKYDELFEEDVRYFTEEFSLLLPVAISPNSPVVAGSIEYKACNMTTFACVSPSFDFEVNVGGAAGIANNSGSTVRHAAAAQDDSLLWFFLLALLAGFAGVLTPCVFPMLPMTVSFFMRKTQGGSAKKHLMVFAFSVVLIYTAIGAIAAVTKSASFATALSTHWLPNLIFFALFIIFAVSFLGAFEITLPQRWTNNADRYADRGGSVGAFFVALTLCIVSFSCTAPFVGALLVAAADGALLKPLIGMLGFGLAFALPFTLLGLFPAALKRMPKSGGWMSIIKVTFAFILLMFGMKFLSAADVDLGLMLLTRELVLSVWIICLVLWGFYILGKLPLAHQEKVEIGAGRLMAAILAFAAALYLLTAFFGARISSIEGWLPEHSSMPYVYTTGQEPDVEALCGEARFADNAALSSPVAGAYFDIKQAQECAWLQGRPLFMYFKGHACANCKKMQNSVLKDARVVELLQNKYVVAVLYTDDKTELPQKDWYQSELDGKTKKTLGQQNLDYLMRRFKVNSVPYFAIEDGDVDLTMGYTSDAQEFAEFLDDGNAGLDF
jgi:thiol:disulfide interchange protein DsbD